MRYRIPVIAALLASGLRSGAQDPPRIGSDKEPRLRPIEYEPRPKPDPDFRFRSGGGLDVAYEDNVYRLDHDAKRKLENDTKVNDRFDRMDSDDDILIHGYGRIDLGWAGIGGKKADFRFDTGYTQYAQNEFKSYAEVEADFTHGTWRGGEAYLETGFIPRRFKKNYFDGATDLNGNGNISQDERSYDHGVYQEWMFGGGVRHLFLNGFSAEAGADYSRRDFREPFENRNEDVVGFGFGLGWRPVDWFRAGFGYRWETGRTGSGAEPVLIDENVHGDVNGDAVTAGHGLVSANVDRSTDVHEVGPDVEFRINDRITFEASYRYVTMDYRSSEPLDFEHRDREDRRHEADAEFKFQLSPDTRLTLGYGWKRQTTKRPNDEDVIGTDRDYQATTVEVGILMYLW